MVEKLTQTYELNLRDYWNIFSKRKLIIAVSFLAVVIGSAVYTNLQPVYYRASAMISVEPIVDRSAVFTYRDKFWEKPNLQSVEEQITSAPIVERAIQESGVLKTKASPKQLAELMRVTMSNLSARSVKDAELVRITLISQDPEQAAILVNKIAEVYKEENLTQRNQQVRNVREFIEQQLKNVSFKLEKAESRLKELTLKGVGGVVDSVNNKIIKLDSERSDLSAKFTPLHPDVIRMEEQIADLKESLKKLPKEEFEFSKLERDARVNEKLYGLLSEKFQEAQIRESEKIDNVFLISPAVPARSPFKPNKQLNYLISIIVGLIFGVSVGLVFEHLDTSIGRIEDLEKITQVSVIGVIPYFTRKDMEIKDTLTKRRFFFKRDREFARADRAEKLRMQLIATHKGNSLFLEAFRILGANIQVVFGKGQRMKGKCIVITSSNPQEGKSIIASNLAVIMAQMGYKTVLVDTDLRRSTIHKVFGLKRKDPGVTDVLTGEFSLESAVRATTDLLLGEIGQEELLRNPWMDNFNLLTAGTTFPNSSYLLNTEKMEQLLLALREKYDVVILDTSPVLAVSDTSIIVPKTDGVVLVYRAGTTSRISLHRAQVQIQSVKDPSILKGIILNNVTPEASIDTYYYYYRGKYYNEKEEEKKA